MATVTASHHGHRRRAVIGVGMQAGVPLFPDYDLESASERADALNPTANTWAKCPKLRLKTSINARENEQWTRSSILTLLKLVFPLPSVAPVPLFFESRCSCSSISTAPA